MVMKDERPAGIKEIATALGLCEKTIRRYHADGKLPTFKPGGPMSPIKMRRVDLRRVQKKRGQ